MTNNNEQKKQATLDDVLTALQQNQQTLDDIKTWIKISGVEKVQSILTKALDTPEKRIVYHLSDGKTTREINAICGVSIGTVSTYWNSWNRLGLMKTISVKRGDRFIKGFDLEDYGIKMPEIPIQKEEQKVEQSQNTSSEPQVTKQTTEVESHDS